MMSKTVKKKNVSNKRKIAKKNVKYAYNFETGDSTEKKEEPKKGYTKITYHLGDGACVNHIQHYVKNPDALFAELLDKVPWGRYEYTNKHGKSGFYPRLMNILHYDDPTKKEAVLMEKLPELDKIKKRLEKLTGRKFRYAVLNYYRDGNDYIGSHSDREVADNSLVISVSIGATRRFVLKHKFREGVKHIFLLAHGDVLILNYDAIKGKYMHSLPKMANVGPRINITFRE